MREWLDATPLCIDLIDIPNAPMDIPHGVLELFWSEFLHLPLKGWSEPKHGGEHDLVRANAVVCSVEIRDE